MSLKAAKAKRPSGRTYATRLDVTKATMVRRALRSVMTKRGKGWTYIDGYSDLRVALKCGVTEYQVGGARRKYFGAMPLGRPTKQEETVEKPSLDSRIERLERLFARMAVAVDPKYLER